MIELFRALCMLYIVGLMGAIWAIEWDRKHRVSFCLFMAAAFISVVVCFNQ